ncbi:AAA family ATPase [Parasphingorhabdus cellanae]|uniref:AAA family ATPase n=1 Tax=Parasphingorhabdus cellanae TaxID=2806553 RepID=UPI0021754448|nr:AAA family ATPase [Parasphingorhabdus cellanae]
MISGCSGGGKSTLLSELNRRGYQVIEEPGRRIVQEERKSGGNALPWINPKAFARRTIEMALSDRKEVSATDSWVFFDRGLVDAATALEHLTATPVLDELAQHHPYHSQVFLTPPWQEIYSQDTDRKHDFSEATAEYSRLVEAYSLLGYKIFLIPKNNVVERAEFVIRSLET